MSFWDYVPHTLKGWAVAPLTGLYALGAGLNELTGGNSTTWSPVAAVQGSKKIYADSVTFSGFTQGASGYQGTTPGSGSWQLPIVNETTTRYIINSVEDAAKPVVFSPLVIAAAAIAAVVFLKE